MGEVCCHQVERYPGVGNVHLAQQLRDLPSQVVITENPVPGKGEAGYVQPLQFNNVLFDFVRTFAKSIQSGDHCTDTGTGDTVDFYTVFIQSLEYTDVRRTQNRTAAESQGNPAFRETS